MNNQDEVVAAVVFKAEISAGCSGCVFINTDCNVPERNKNFPCDPFKRNDGRKVIWTIKHA